MQPGSVPDRTAPATARGSRIRGYLQILAVVSGARLFGLASQFLVLVILSRILSKDSFGDMMTAFSFYRLASIALGVGPSLLLLFHISRSPHDREAEVRLHRYSAILGALISGVVALAGVFAAGPIAAALGKPALAAWFVLLAPFAVFSTLLIVATGALEGRSRISESIVLGEAAPNAIRIVLLPIIAFAGLPDDYVAHAMTASVLAPWLWAARRIWSRKIAGTTPWSRWDYDYSAKYVVATLFANQLAAVDILVAGTLFSSEIAAEYAVASRIAALYSFFQLALLKRFAPRAATLLEGGNNAALRVEVELCRRLTIGCAAFTICGIVLIAPYLLPVFGHYAGAEVLLIWLAIPTFIQSFYMTSDRLLTIGGQANVALAVTGLSFLTLVTMPVAGSAAIGPLAIPAAMIVSAILFQPFVATKARKLFDIRTVGFADLAAMLCGSLAIAGHALVRSPLSAVAACATLAALALVYMVPAVMRVRTRADAPATS